MLVGDTWEIVTDGHTWTVAASLAPLATALIALGAATIALHAVKVQRDIARRRAAIDFFLKTEMDEKVIESYKHFEETTPKASSIVADAQFGPDSDHHHKLRKWLNVCELISVGINKGAFSESVSFDYWGDVLPSSFKDAKPYIDHIRNRKGMGGPLTFSDLEDVCTRWAKFEKLSPRELRRQLRVERS
jgi:hypothetical protein